MLPNGWTKLMLNYIVVKIEKVDKKIYFEKKI